MLLAPDLALIRASLCLDSDHRGKGRDGGKNELVFLFPSRSKHGSLGLDLSGRKI